MIGRKTIVCHSGHHDWANWPSKVTSGEFDFNFEERICHIRTKYGLQEFGGNQKVSLVFLVLQLRSRLKIHQINIVLVNKNIKIYEF